MRPIVPCVLWLGALLVCSSASLAAPLPLEQLLTPEEFQRAGLDRLTAEELRFLNERLAQKQPAPAEEAVRPPESPVATFGKEGFPGPKVAAQTEIKAISSRIRGPFPGWGDRTLFRLENGQVWRQADGDRFSIHVDDPEVVVERGSMGAYYLRVEGYGARVRVVRVR